MSRANTPADIRRVTSRIAWTAAIFLQVVLFASAASAATTTYNITYDGVARQYLLYQPGCYADSPLSLVVALHGDAVGSSGAGIEGQSGFDDVAEQQCFFAAYPSALTGYWEDNTDIGYVEAVIADVESRFAVDQTRVFLVGHSGGARLTAGILCNWPSGIAAIAQVSYDMRQSDLNLCANTPAKPAILLHGTADTLDPYDGRATQLSAEGSAAYWAGKYGPGDPFLSDVTVEIDTGLSTVGQIYSWAAPVKFYSLTAGGHPFPSSSPRNVSSDVGGPTVTVIGGETQDPGANVIWTFFRGLSSSSNGGGKGHPKS